METVGAVTRGVEKEMQNGARRKGDDDDELGSLLRLSS
jgi:hypothetical protein